MADSLIVLPGQLGSVLRAMRRQRGLSQAKLGEKLGVSKQAISDLERAPEKASFERLHRACAALDIEIVLRPRASRPATEW